MRQFSNRVLSWSIRLSLILSAISLFLYAYLGKDMRMIADDFCSAYRGLRYGPLEGFLVSYQNWASNYSNVIVKYSFAPYQPSIHPWVSLITVIGFLGAFYYLALVILDWIKFPRSRIFAVMLSALFSFVLYRIFPSYQHAWWYGAVIPNTWSLILLIVYLASFTHYWRENRSVMVQILMLIYTAIMITIIVGFKETLSAFIIAGFAVGALFVIKIHPSRKREWLSICILIIVNCLIVMFLVLVSPGARARQEIILAASNLTRPSLLETIVPSLYYTVLYIFGEPFGFAFGQTVALGFLGFLFAILFFGAGVVLRRTPDYLLPAPKNLGLWAIAIGILGIYMIFSIMWPIYYSANAIVIRPLITARFVQVLMIVAWAYLAIAAGQRHNMENRLKRSKVFPFLILASAFLLIWTPAFSIFRLLEAAPNMAAYASSWDARHEFLLSQNGQELVYLEPLAYDIEDLLALEKMETENGAGVSLWVNACVENYYHIEHVFIQADD